MRWAFTIISLSAAWRKIWDSLTTLKQWELITSRSTFPGPTLGSWFTSPTKIRRVPTAIAFNKLWNRKISTIDISSIITTSVSSGFHSFLPNKSERSSLTFSCSAAAPLYSNRRWMVCASWPVASAIRLAARPVGAASKIGNPFSIRHAINVLIVVVLPVPGPPVITKNPLVRASLTAIFCWSSSTISWLFSTRKISSSKAFVGRSTGTFRSNNILAQFISE